MVESFRSAERREGGTRRIYNCRVRIVSSGLINEKSAWNNNAIKARPVFAHLPECLEIGGGFLSCVGSDN